MSSLKGCIYCRKDELLSGGVRADVGDKGHPYMDHAAGFALWPDPLARKNRDVIQ
jgi:hypothetical protein